MSIIHPWYQLGYVIPHMQTDMDAYQFYNIAPPGVMLITTGLNLQGHSVEAVEHEMPLFQQRVDLIAKKKPDRIALSGVPVASFLGRKKMLEHLATAQARCGVPCDTDLEAHIAVLKHFGADKIAMATRWNPPTLERLTRYLNEAGIEVLGHSSRGTTLDAHKTADPKADHEMALDLGRSAMRTYPQAKALLMPGGLWHAMHAVPILEAEFGVPVLINILSTTWAALHSAGPKLQHRPDPKWGKLMAAV
jgi:maleate cis-trans isomerase